MENSKIDLDKIKELHRKLATLYNLNNGGCVHFAYFFSKRLRQLKIKHNIVVFDSSERISLKRKKLQEWISTKESTKLCCNHVVVKIGDFYIDGYYSFIFGERHWFNYNFGSITFKELELIRKHGSWNSMYKKRQNLFLHNIIKHTIK